MMMKIGKLALVASGLTLGAGMAWGAETAPAGAVVGFGTDAVVEGDRVQATGEAIQLKAKKPAAVENACFFRVLVNAADKK